MAFPTTGILDTAVRANEGPPASTSWTTGAAGGVLGMKISSNTIVAATPSTGDGWWNPSTFGPDSEVYCTIVSGMAGRTLMYLRLVGVPGFGNGYQLRNTDIQVRINRFDSGAATQLGLSIVVAFADGDSVGGDVIGNDVTFYQKTGGTWTTIGTRNDATYTAAGFIGLGYAVGTPAATDFGGGTVGGTPVVPGELGTFPTALIRARRTSW